MFRASRELIESAPEELMIFDVLITAPPAPPFPPELQGQKVAVVGIAWCGDLAEGERVLAPLREAHPPALDLVQPMPYVALQTMLDETAPHGLRYYDKLHYLAEVSDGYIDTLARRVRERADAAVARGDRLDGRRCGPRAARRHGIRPSRRARARLGDRVLGRRADRAHHRLGEAHLGCHPAVRDRWCVRERPRPGHGR